MAPARVSTGEHSLASPDPLLPSSDANRERVLLALEVTNPRVAPHEQKPSTTRCVASPKTGARRHRISNRIAASRRSAFTALVLFMYERRQRKRKYDFLCGWGCWCRSTLATKTGNASQEHTARRENPLTCLRQKLTRDNRTSRDRFASLEVSSASRLVTQFV